MKKLLVNVVSALILSVCISSCSEKEDDVVIPASKADVVKEWTISSVSVNIPISDKLDASTQAKIKQFSDTLGYLFKTGDTYKFEEDLSCTVKRNGNQSTRPSSYTVDESNGVLIFDGYIKFKTNMSSGNLILTAGTKEIQEIAAEELSNSKYGYTTVQIDAIKSLFSGELKLVLTQK